jgi:hypothetical protein
MREPIRKHKPAVAPVFVITAKCDLRHKEAARRCVTSSNLWLPAARPLSAPERVSSIVTWRNPDGPLSR